MKKLLWLDDIRNPSDYLEKDEYEVTWVKNYKDFCIYIEENGVPDYVCFDHDLGEDKTGYDCAKFLVEVCQKMNRDIPYFDIQSSNIVGKKNIRDLMNSWHKIFMNK